MHPTLMHEIARYRQADMLREAEQERLAHEVKHGLLQRRSVGSGCWAGTGRGARTARLQPLTGGLAACRRCDGALRSHRRGVG